MAIYDNNLGGDSGERHLERMLDGALEWNEAVRATLADAVDDTMLRHGASNVLALRVPRIQGAPDMDVIDVAIVRGAKAFAGHTVVMLDTLTSHEVSDNPDTPDRVLTHRAVARLGRGDDALNVHFDEIAPNEKAERLTVAPEISHDRAGRLALQSSVLASELLVGEDGELVLQDFPNIPGAIEGAHTKKAVRAAGPFMTLLGVARRFGTPYEVHSVSYNGVIIA